ncbi:MAG: hypothetical protein ACRDT2_10165 [Natronosporangium sp.]
MAETDQARATAATLLDLLTAKALAASADGLSDVEVWMVLLLSALDSPVSRERMAIAMAEAVLRLSGVGQPDGPAERIAPVDLDARTGSELCGSVRGYSRHRRHGEPTCPECRAAIAEYHRQRRTGKS